MKKSNIGVLLVNLGTPSQPSSQGVKTYLREFLTDPRVIDISPRKWKFILNWFILPRRAPKVAKLYKEIWTDNGSPLLATTYQQMQALVDYFRDSVENIVFDIGMTYGNPSIDNAISHLISKDIDRLIILPLYPQYSSTTSASVFDAFAKALKKHRNIPKFDFIHSYHDHPFYIDALVNSIHEGFGVDPNSSPIHNPKAKLIFSYHGIPLSYEKEGDYYRTQCIETSDLVAQKLGLSQNQYLITFQSRFGNDPWLEPYTDKTLASLPSQGIDSVSIICPGFSVDCLETIEEIEQENRDNFINTGGKLYYYIPALNATASHIKLLACLINNKVRNN